MAGRPCKPDMVKNDFPSIAWEARLPLEQLLLLRSVPYEVGTSRYSVREPMTTLPRENVTECFDYWNALRTAIPNECMR